MLNSLQQQLIDLIDQKVVHTGQIRTAFLVKYGRGLMLSKLSRALSEMEHDKYIEVAPNSRGYRVTVKGFAEREKMRGEAEARKGIPLPRLTLGGGQAGLRGGIG